MVLLQDGFQILIPRRISETKAIQMKATKQSLPVLPFFLLYIMVLAFELVDEIIKCDLNDRSVLSCGAVHNDAQCGSNF